MLNKLNNTPVIAVATLTAICLMAGLARAEDGGHEDYLIPAAYYVAGENGGIGSEPTCKELREAAWFLNEMARSDGDASPKAPDVVCRPDFLAESTVDAD